MRKTLVILALLGAVAVLTAQVQVPTPPYMPVSISTSSPVTMVAGVPTVTNPGANYVSFPFSTGIQVISNRGICWTPSTDVTAAADTCISRGGAGEILFSLPVTFATLGTPSNGSFGYCSDCTIANPCAGSGTGAFAKRLNGVWVCN